MDSDRSSDREIKDVRIPILVNEDCSGPQVAVNDAVSVSDGDDVAQVALWLKKWDQPKPFRDAMKAGKVNPEDVTQIVIKVGRKGIFKVAQDIDTKQPGIIKRLLPLITKMLNV